MIGALSIGLFNASAGRAAALVGDDLAYGEDARQRLDVHRPRDAAGPSPVVIFFYGGSWQSGEKRHYRFVAQALARHGVMTVIPNYRLSPAAGFPAFVEDGAAAAAWVAARIGAHGGNPTRVFLAGHSAGAHIALLLALDRHYLDEAGFPRAALAGAIGLSGPYDFLPIKRPDIKRVFASPPCQQG